MISHPTWASISLRILAPASFLICTINQRNINIHFIYKQNTLFTDFSFIILLLVKKGSFF